jgi:hypothetical protein
MDINWNSATVIDNAQRSIGHQSHLNLCAISCERFIDCVIDDFIDKVMQTAFAGRADIHTWALADRLKPLEDGDRGGVVSARFLLRISQGEAPSNVLYRAIERYFLYSRL